MRFQPPHPFNSRSFNRIIKFLVFALLLPLFTSVSFSATPAKAATQLFFGAGDGIYTVPANVKKVHIVLVGANGGRGGSDGQAPGTGLWRGKVEGDLTVTPGQRIWYAVGYGGANGAGCVAGRGYGAGGSSAWGYSGGAGGDALVWGCSGGGGGGGAATAINIEGDGSGNDIVAAGAGGGAGANNCLNAPGEKSLGASLVGSGRSGSNGVPNPYPPGGQKDGGGAGGGGGGWLGGRGGGWLGVPGWCGEGIADNGSSGSNYWPSKYNGVLASSTDQGSPTWNGGLWITPYAIPDTPTNVQASTGYQNSIITWNKPSNNGSTITRYTVTASPGGATCTSSNENLTSCTVTGLDASTAYTFTVVATNGDGDSPRSSPSNSVTPGTLSVTYSSQNSSSGSAPVDSSAYRGNASVTVAGAGTLVRAGYYVSGWNNKADLTGTSYSFGGSFNISTPTTLYPIWSQYTITYSATNKGSGNVPSNQLGFGSTTLATQTKDTPNRLNRNGYYLSGWTIENVDYALGATYTISKNVTATAKWSNATLTYTAPNKSSGTIPSQIVSGGDQVLATGTGLIRTGYYFAGWSINGVNYTAGQTYYLNSDATASAIWAQYKINYSDSGKDSGSAPAATYGYGATAVSGNTGSLVKANYYFNGWYKSGSSGDAYLPGESITISAANDNSTLNPRWSQAVITFSDTGKSSGSPTNATVTSGGDFVLPGAGSMVKTNYYFNGWTINGAVYATGSHYNLVSAVTATPNWSQQSITFDRNSANSGSVPATINGYGNTVLPDNTGNLKRTNYYFAGWYSNSSGTGGVSYKPGARLNVTSDVTLFALWRQYSLTYLAPDKTSGNLPAVVYGFETQTVAIASATTIAKNSNVLVGWSTVQNNGGAFYPLGSTINLQADTQLYAVFLIPQTTPLVITTPSTSSTPPVKFPLTTDQGYFTTIALSATGGNGNGAISYLVTGSNCVLTDTYKLSATASADCYVTAVKAAEGGYAQAKSSEVYFDFYPTPQAHALLIDRTNSSSQVGTPIKMLLTSSTPGTDGGGDGTGAISWAVFGTNCYLSNTGGDTYLNTNATSICRVIVTRAASGKWAIATSQAPAVFTFNSIPQTSGPTGFRFSPPADGYQSATFNGSGIVLSTTGGNGSGNVTFTAYGLPATGCSVGGSLNNVLTVSNPGTCDVVAYKSGTGIYSGILSQPQRFVFSGGTQGALTITDSLDPAKDIATGTPVSLSTSQALPVGSGKIQFATSSANCIIQMIGSSTAGAAILRGTALNPCVVTAYRSGDAQYAGVLSAPKTYVFGLHQDTLNLTYSASSNPFTSPITLGISQGVNKSSGLISFVKQSPCYTTNVDASMGTANLYGGSVGSCIVSVARAGDSNYLPVKSSDYTFSFTIGGQLSLRISRIDPETSTTVAAGTAVHLTAVGGSGSGSMNWSVSSGSCLLSQVDNSTPGFATVQSTTPGTCTITAIKSGDATYSANTSTIDLKFSGLSQSIVLSSNVPTAAALSNINLSATGFTGTGAITFTASGSGCTISADPDTRSGKAILSANSASSCFVKTFIDSDSLYVAAYSAGQVFNFTKATSASPLTVTYGLQTSIPGDNTYYISTSGGSGTGAVSLAAYGGNCYFTDTSTTGTGSGILHTSVAPWSCRVIATKGADSTYQAQNSDAQTLSFTAVTPTNFLLSFDNQSANTTTAIKLSTSGSHLGGNVRFALNPGSASSCTLNQTLASLTAPGGVDLTSTSPGICKVIGVQSAFGVYGVAITPQVTFDFGTDQTPLSIEPQGGTAFQILNPGIETVTAGTAINLSTRGGSSTGAVTYTKVVDNDPKSLTPSWPCQVVGSTLNATQAGATCTVFATKAGDGTYRSVVSSPSTFVFAGAAQDTLTITATSGTSSKAGTAIRIGSKGGSGIAHYSFVAFNASGANCQVNYSGLGGDNQGSVNSSTAGVCSVIALNSANGIYKSAQSTPVAFVFGNTTQPDVFTISNEQTASLVGAPITLRTKGGTGAGAVTFALLSNADKCLISADGNLVVNRLTAGVPVTCAVQATKAADATYGAQRSQTVVFTFSGLAQSPLSINNAVTTASSNSDSITLSTIGGSDTGTVTYSLGTGSNCSVIGSTLTSNISGGSCSVTATKLGSTTYASTVSPAVLFTFPAAPTSPSTINTLSGLETTQGQLSPSFSELIDSYTVTVENRVTSIIFYPSYVGVGEIVTINGSAVASGVASNQISLTVGNNDVTIATRSGSGATKTYIVHVTRSG